MRFAIASTLFIPLGIIISNSIASPLLAVTSVENVSAQKLFAERPAPAGNNRDRNSKYPIADRASLQERSVHLTNFGNGWVGYVTTSTSLLPVQTAAAALFRFYISAYNQLQSVPTDIPPQYQFSLTLDNLTLKFFSADAPIPWRFMAAVAWKMATLAQRGFTARHDSVYVYQPTGQAIRISLEVLLVAAAA